MSDIGFDQWDGRLDYGMGHFMLHGGFDPIEKGHGGGIGRARPPEGFRDIDANEMRRIFKIAAWITYGFDPIYMGC